MSTTALLNRFLNHTADGTRLTDEPLREAQPAEMLVQMTRSLISVGTEMAYRMGGPNLRVHRGKSGYSAVGRVLELARAPEMPASVGAAGQIGADRPLAVGDRVFCQTGHAAFFHWPTGRACYRVPDEITDRQATFGALGQIAMHMVERAQISIGRTVVVVGQGTVGQLVNQLARIAGAGQVIGVDLAPEARALSLQLGANAAIPPDAAQLEAELRKRLPGSAAPVLIEVTASAKALEWTIAHAPLHARVVVTGTYGTDVTLNPFLAWIEKELDIVGAHQPKCPDRLQTYSPYNAGNNLLQAWRFIAQKRLNVDALIDADITPEAAVRFFNDSAAGRRAYRQPVIDWEAQA